MRSSSRELPWVVLLAVVAATLFLGLQVAIYPLMDGWGYYPLGDLALVPYRDYFFPVPPLTYWEAAGASALGLPLIATRLIFLIVPAVLAASLYSLARIFTARTFSFTAALLGVAALATIRLETLQGWNLQALTYLAAGVALMARGWTVTDGDATRRSRRLTTREWALCLSAGAAFSAALLAKQTTLVSAVLVLAAAIASPRVTQDGRLVGRRLSLVAATLAIPVVVGVVTVTYLWSRAALGPFVDAMTSGGGKGPSLSKLGAFVLDAATIYLPVIVVLAFLACLLVWLLRASSREAAPARQFALTTIIVALATAPTAIITSANQPDWAVLATAIWIVATALIVAVAGRALSSRRRLSWMLPTGGLIVPLVIYVSLAEERAAWFADFGRLALWILGIAIFGGSLVVLVGMLAPRLAAAFWRLVAVPPESRAIIAGPRRRFVLLLGTAVVVGSLVNSLSSTGAPTIDWFLPGAVVTLAFAWSVVRAAPHTRVLGGLAVTWIWVIVAATAVLTSIHPYAWFGWTEPSLVPQARVVSDFPHARGVLLAPSVYDFYARLADAESSASEQSSSQVATVFAFPNVPAAVTVTGIRPYPVLPCPTIWFDLCPDSTIASSLTSFMARPADVVVWANIDEPTLAWHEREFTGHRSAVRDWIDYKDDMVRTGTWQLVDRIPVTPDSPNRWPISVYSTQSVPRA